MARSHPARHQDGQGQREAYCRAPAPSCLSAKGARSRDRFRPARRVDRVAWAATPQDKSIFEPSTDLAAVVAATRELVDPLNIPVPAFPYREHHFHLAGIMGTKNQYEMIFWLVDDTSGQPQYLEVRAVCIPDMGVRPAAGWWGEAIDARHPAGRLRGRWAPATVAAARSRSHVGLSMILVCVEENAVYS